MEGYVCSSWMIGLVLLLCVLHGCFAAAIAAMETLGSSLKGMAEQNPKLQYYAKQKRKLRRTAAAERMLFDVCVTAWLYSAFWFNWRKELGALPAGWVIALAGASALLALLLFHGLVNGIGRKKAESVAAKLAGYVRVLTGLLTPLWAIYSGVERAVGGTWVKPDAVTEEDIIQMVEEGNETGVIEESQREMINNIFEFDDIVVSDVMTHRTEIVAVEVEEPISSVIHTVIQEGYSRMPVYQGNIDNIVGILMAKDLLCLAGQDNLEHYHIRHFMREVVFVPETAKCKHVLQEMALKKSQLAVVVDEYGGTAGIVSMEDILEEIVGNIQDEYDEEEIEMRKVSDAVYIIKGTADPDDILPQLGVTLPEGREFDTMSGFVVELLGRIPEAEETPSVQYESVLFTVLLIEDNWVSKIKAQILPPEPQKEEGMEKHGEEGK
ncbi:hemolysins and related proteins containing CBS domains [Ruminococcus sp. CAG:403]|nr:hemolysins and related proteins containing CBS domains [Ruminococcus sp. CAG:403]